MNKPFRFVLFCATFLLSLISCGDGASNTETKTDTIATSDTASTVAMPAQSTIVTTPENIIVVRYKISNFAKWRSLYDTRDSMRTANGIHNYVLGRGVYDSSQILVALKTDDMAKAKAFTKEAALKSALQKGFVTGTPKYNFTTSVYQDMSTNMSDLRSITFFTVKDWDTWKKVFEAGKQIRLDNGLVERAYGHDVDDNHKVVLVVAINDSAKAEAYWKSDLIKRRRAESGVVGDVERFVYRVIQRY